MAKITGNNPPLSDWEYQDATGDDHFLGEFYRQALKEAFPSLADPDTDITGQSSRGARPSQQGEGTPKQSEIRKIFQDCAALWNSLPEECPEPPTDPPTTSKASVWQAKQDFGVVCSYLDLFMRCCITFALDNEGAMPDGDCFPCGPGCTCDGISIGYTTLGMGVDEEQTLTVEGAIGDCTYQWAIVSGGGELSGAEGFAVIYTAPATNPSCSLNPTISLGIDSVVCDSITIGINAVSGTAIAVTQCQNRTCPPCTLYGGKCGACWSHFKCDGGYYEDLEHVGCACMGGDEYGTLSAYYNTCEEGPYNVGYNDRRTPAMIAAGCCPEQLL